MKNRCVIVVLGVFLLLFASCTSTAPTEPLQKKYEQIIEFSGLDSKTIFDRANVWAVSTFNSADAVIEYSNEETGTIAGKFVYDVFATYFFYNIDKARVILTINVKDNRCRLTYQMADIHITGASSLWRAPSDAEFKQMKFEETCESLTQDFKKAIETTDDW